jgi:hypothetical protein
MSRIVGHCSTSSVGVASVTGGTVAAAAAAAAEVR